ncbi:hypothetical protein [Candidatus Uabimicrobium sp. HlEnr_7]|uniref:hypothetical protein n=1 Tax=Candidatus Uabimicrobium helgolandensis TaxID=3095367 RepID=UPI0035581D3D
MSIFRYLFGLFRCHGTANQKALSIAIGTIIGLVYSAGVTWLLFLPLLLIFRFSIPFVLCSTLIFWGISEIWLLELSHQVGFYFLGGNSSWSFFWEELTHTPILSFFELNRYSAFGAWMIAGVTAFFLYIVTYLIAVKLTGSSLANSLHYSKMATKIRSTLWKDNEVKGNKILRSHLTIYLLILSVLMLAFVSLCSGIVTKWYIEKYVNPELGLHIEIENASLDVWNRKILISQMEIKNPKSNTILLTSDFLNIDFSLTSIFNKQLKINNANLSGTKLYLVKKDGKLNLSQLNMFSDTTPEKNDWVRAFHKLLRATNNTEVTQKQKRIKMVEDYIFLHSPKKPLAVQTLLNETDTNKLSKLDDLQENEMIFQSASANYIKKKSVYFIDQIECSKLKIYFQDQDKSVEQILELQFAVRNLSSSAIPLSPVEIEILATDIPAANYRFLHESSSDIWFTAGSILVSFKGKYDQGLLSGNGEVLFENAKLQSSDEAQVFSMNAREFLWGLNKTDCFSTPFTLNGSLSELNFEVPKEPLMTVSKTTNSNVEKN